MFRRILTNVLVALLAVALAGTATATAAKLISGKQIKDGTITTKDLSKGTRAALAKAGRAGAAGGADAAGNSGGAGTQGPIGLTSEPARSSCGRSTKDGVAADRPFTVVVTC